MMGKITWCLSGKPLAKRQAILSTPLLVLVTCSCFAPLCSASAKPKCTYITWDQNFVLLTQTLLSVSLSHRRSLLMLLGTLVGRSSREAAQDNSLVGFTSADIPCYILTSWPIASPLKPSKTHRLNGIKGETVFLAVIPLNKIPLFNLFNLTFIIPPQLLTLNICYFPLILFF